MDFTEFSKRTVIKKCLTPDLNLPLEDQSTVIKYLYAGGEPTTQGTWNIGGWKIKQVKLDKTVEKWKWSQSEISLQATLGTASVFWLYSTILMQAGSVS